MKIISALYGCSYCNFTSDNTEEIKKHELKCLFNPNNTEAKNDIINEMKECTSIKDLNEKMLHLLNILKIVPEELLENNGEDYVYDMKDRSVLFSIQKYKLYNYWSKEFSNIGIPVKLEEYPKIEKLIEEMKKINKTSSEINSDFKKYKTSEIERKIKENVDLELLKNEELEISKKLEKLSKQRFEIKEKSKNILKTIETLVIKEYGYINPNIRLEEIRNILEI